MKTLLPLAVITLCLAGCGPATSTDSQTTKTTTTETTTTSATPGAVPADGAPAATGMPAATAPVMAPGTLTQANLDRVHQDMSEAEVKAIFGEPTSVSETPIPIVGGTQTTYDYSSGGSAVTIMFKNDREQTKSGTFNP